jgi:hypothetical protein
LLDIDAAHSHGYRDAILNGFEGIKPGWTRLNFNSFINPDEFEFLLTALEFVADHGERFVQLYDFDWHSGAWKHPLDTAPKSLFAHLELEIAPAETGAAPDYAGYLEFAHELAAGLEPHAARPIPPEVNPELVFFTA